VAEWFKAAVLKTARGFTLPRGFESHPFRQPASMPISTKRSHALHRLTAKEVTTLPEGTYHDGGGLYLLADAREKARARRALK
jgi:hypothetical protein